MVKNRILINLCRMNVVIFLLSACLLDSDGYFPVVTMLLSSVWLLLFMVANWERCRV